MQMPGTRLSKASVNTETKRLQKHSPSCIRSSEICKIPAFKGKSHIYVYIVLISKCSSVYEEACVHLFYRWIGLAVGVLGC